MKKKLQVFISSTYRDLIEERDYAIKGVLDSGHFPVGMEFFKSGDKTQIEVIRKAIDESDIYMLILGDRYGSIDEKSGKSYTELEYDYAIDTGKRVFSIVLSDKYTSKLEVIEESNSKKEKLDLFKNKVESKICKFIDIKNEINGALLGSIREIELDKGLNGWINIKKYQIIFHKMKLNYLMKNNIVIKL
jgi:hypothetical protein